MRDVARIDSSFSSMLTDMITHRYRLGDVAQAFAAKDLKHIKTVFEVETWE